MAGFNFGNFDFNALEGKGGGDSVSVDLPAGPYKGEIVACEQTVAKSGRPQFKFSIKVVENANPALNGAVRTEWISLPNTPEDKVMTIWALAMKSIGLTNEQLRGAGNIGFEQTPGLFIGRVGHFVYTKGNKDLGQYDKIKFVTPDNYAYHMKNAQTDTVGAPINSAIGGGVSVSAPVAGGLNAGGSSALAALIGQ